VPEDQRFERLKTIIGALESTVVAFSGGVDSSLLLKIAYDVLGDRPVLVVRVDVYLLPLPASLRGSSPKSVAA
jgi:uncharacterized protein